MRKVALTVLAATALLLTRPAGAHCQVPCGIYDDMLRIDMLIEDIQTIEKSIAAIQELAGKSAAADLNQLVRWVENKDRHADHIAEIVSEYFLRQRIKAPAGDKPDEAARYVEQLKALHALLVTSMKAKQSVDAQLPAQLRAQVERFKQLYFSAEDLAHGKKGSH